MCSSSKGTPFLKIPALPGNWEKTSDRVSVSLPGVGKIPVASLPLAIDGVLEFTSPVPNHTPRFARELDLVTIVGHIVLRALCLQLLVR